MFNLKNKVIIAAAIVSALALVSGYKAISVRSKLNESKETSSKKEISTKPIKLDWYLHASWYYKHWDTVNTLFDKIVTEKTGVDLNIIVPVSATDEKLIAMAVSGNMPDIITIDNWNGVREQMLESGYFQPLNKLAEKYAPEFLNIIPDSMKRWLTQEDGNWYAISNFYTAPEWLANGESIENDNGIIARKDIMDKLGIKPEDFDTQDGAIEALKKVKSSGLVYSGREVTPIYVQLNDWAMARMWGIPWETPEGDWIDYKTHPKYLEMYKFLNRLWREGLIAEDNLTMGADEKVQKGNNFAYMGNLGSMANSLSIAYNQNNKIVYVPVGPIHALDAAEALYDQAGTGWMSTFITKSNKHPDKSIKLLSFLASDEGQMLNWYGVENNTYKLVDGKVQYNSEYLHMKKENPDLAKKVYGFDDFWPMQQPLFAKRYKDIAKLPQDEVNYNVILNYFSKFTINTPETMGVQPAQGTAEAGIREKIESFWNNETRKMILADSSKEVEQIYNDAIKYIDELGYKRVYAASNEIFQAQKKKMGKLRSFPYDNN